MDIIKIKIDSEDRALITELYALSKDGTSYFAEATEFFLIKDGDRGVLQDPTILVAVTAATATAITALINGIFALMNQKRQAIRIVVELDDRNIKKIEIDGLNHMSKEDVLLVVNEIQKLQSPRLIISDRSN